jgi:hypothetical protein
MLDARFPTSIEHPVSIIERETADGFINCYTGV